MSASVSYITPSALAALLRAQASLAPALRRVRVYDVRDEDRAGGHLSQSTHVGSEEFLRSAHRVAGEIAAEGVADTVAFHCTFSQVRGPRCARRFADALERKGVQGIRVLVVEGGFKACARLWPKQRDLFEDFDERVNSWYWDD
jgi:Cdc25 family phosphatase